jgi:hypothetical protein
LPGERREVERKKPAKKTAEISATSSVRARPWRLSVLSGFRSKLSFYGDVVLMRRALTDPFRRFSARGSCSRRDRPAARAAPGRPRRPPRPRPAPRRSARRPARRPQSACSSPVATPAAPRRPARPRRGRRLPR